MYDLSLSSGDAIGGYMSEMLLKFSVRILKVFHYSIDIAVLHQCIDTKT